MYQNNTGDYTGLDYCNSLLYGINDGLLKKLQAVQNAAARVTTMTRKFDHITPVLRALASGSQAHHLQASGDGLQVSAQTGATIPGWWRCAGHLGGEPTSPSICCVRLPRCHWDKNNTWQKELRSHWSSNLEQSSCLSATPLAVTAVIWTTRCSAIAERPRCRVRYSFRQKYTVSGKKVPLDFFCCNFAES